MLQAGTAALSSTWRLINPLQVAAKMLQDKDRGADITRSYVQKSLCVISRKGLYGLLQVYFVRRMG